MRIYTERNFMKIYFLGTGTSQGIPVIGDTHPVCLSSDKKDVRLRVSVWVQSGEDSIVIDCGPDFRQQMLQSKCPKIDAILFTHEHSDHTAGIDDIRPFNFKQKNAIPFYAHQRVIENLEKRFEYVFETENRYPGAPSIETIPVVKNHDFVIGSTSVTPIDALHGDLQVFGYKINGFAYLTDVKTIHKEEMDKLQNIEILVINALREESHYSHFNLAEALSFIDQIKPKKAYLTHISHLMGFHEEVQKQLPENVYLAYDNLQLTL